MRYSEDDRNIYSHSGREKPADFYEDISSFSEKGQEPDRPAPVKKSSQKKKKHPVRRMLIVLLCLCVIAAGGLYAYVYRLLDQIERDPLDQSDLGISTDEYAGYRNIALLGIDSRKDNTSGRSDAIVVLSVDKSGKKIRLTSIARDSYVAIDGHSHDKLTHAYAYGKSQLTVKTLNQNFGLEIHDYVTMNFFELARVIDYIGGVTIDVDQAERKELNNILIPQMVRLGVSCDPVPDTGSQLLSGGQAVAYARIRHTDSDIQRGNRQKEVLMAMYAQVKKNNLLKLPRVAEMVIGECQTSLSTKDLISLGTWALTASPDFEQLSIPNDDVPAKGTIIHGGWYYVYDLDLAKKSIHDFITGKTVQP